MAQQYIKNYTNMTWSAHEFINNNNKKNNSQFVLLGREPLNLCLYYINDAQWRLAHIEKQYNNIKEYTDFRTQTLLITGDSRSQSDRYKKGQFMPTIYVIIIL